MTALLQCKWISGRWTVDTDIREETTKSNRQGRGRWRSQKNTSSSSSLTFCWAWPYHAGAVSEPEYRPTASSSAKRSDAALSPRNITHVCSRYARPPFHSSGSDGCSGHDFQCRNMIFIKTSPQISLASVRMPILMQIRCCCFFSLPLTQHSRLQHCLV